MLHLSNFYSDLEFRVIIRKHAYQCQSNSFLKFPQHPLFEYVNVHTQCMVATSEWHIFHDPSSTYKKQFQEYCMKLILFEP